MILWVLFIGLVLMQSGVDQILRMVMLDFLASPMDGTCCLATVPPLCNIVSEILFHCPSPTISDPTRWFSVMFWLYRMCIPSTNSTSSFYKSLLMYVTSISHIPPKLLTKICLSTFLLWQSQRSHQGKPDLLIWKYKLEWVKIS